MDKIEIVQGDITRMDVDVIVNAAKNSLLGGGGVDGSIHRAAGPALLRECRMIGGCETGQACMTGGYDLLARHVIHTVGPVWSGGSNREDELLASCYRNSLSLALKHELRTIAFPAISCGVYRFPAERAAGIALTEIQTFLGNYHGIDKVYCVCFDEAMADIYRSWLVQE